MTTINLQVGADDSDSYNFGGSQVDTSANVYWNYSSAAAVLGGSRFINVTIAQASIIDSATMQIYIVASSMDDIDFDIYAEDVDNSGVLEGGTALDARTLTTESVRWTSLSAGTGFQTSPSVIDVIQEVIDRGGWSSGNALSIIGNDPQTVSAARSHDYSDVSSRAAKLDIDFTAGGTPPIATQRLKSGVGR